MKALVIVYSSGLYRSAMVYKDGGLLNLGRYLERLCSSEQDALSFVTTADPQYDVLIHHKHTILSESILDRPCEPDYIYLHKDGVWSLLDPTSMMRLYWYHPTIDECQLDTVKLKCSICGTTKVLHLKDEIWDWSAECFLGQVNIGSICPRCKEQFTQTNAGTHECELIVSKLNDPNICKSICRILGR